MTYRNQVIICGGVGCDSSKSPLIKEEFDRLIKEYKLENDVYVDMSGCFSLCDKGPVVLIHPDNIFYSKVKPKDVEKIVKDHLLEGKIVKRLQYKEINKEGKKEAVKFDDIKTYKHQVKRALRNCGIVNPYSLEEYIGRDGFFALEKAINEMTPDEVIKEIFNSGLRGRGGEAVFLQD